MGHESEYEIGALIGEGAFADVFDARERQSGARVAFKRARGRGAVERMRREILVQRQIRHPNVMPILDAGDDASWFAMPRATRSLGDAFSDDPPFDIAAISRLIDDVCPGLNAAHELGFVHRDLSPPNILWLDGRWVVADWGLVRPIGETVTSLMTTSGGLLPWTAPEAWYSQVDRRADVYSVGRLVGWLASRRCPLPNAPSEIDFRDPWFDLVRETTASRPEQRIPDMGGVMRLADSIKERARRAREAAARPLLPANCIVMWNLSTLNGQATQLYVQCAIANAGEVGGALSRNVTRPILTLSEESQRAAARMAQLLAPRFPPNRTFEFEGRQIAAVIRHDHIVRTLGAGAYDGDPNVIQLSREAQFAGSGYGNAAMVRLDELGEEIAAAFAVIDSEAKRIAADGYHAAREQLGLPPLADAG
jgi:serine/threonine protein kinase